MRSVEQVFGEAQEQNRGNASPGAEVHWGWPDPRRWEPTSLFIFSLQNPIRKGAIVLCEHGRLDAGVLVAILASTGTMALSDPFDTMERQGVSEVREALALCSLVFSSIFVAEVGIKVVAYGLILGPKAYLKQGWNVADFALACLGALSDFAPGNTNGPSFLRTVRSLRALRPLRTIARFPDLRAMVELIAKVQIPESQLATSLTL